MTKPLPSLALEMSQDGIALHQLAFDGHWHELSRVALNDAALREKLANMRAVATKLEGRGFKTRLWLPSDQIIEQSVPPGSTEAHARAAEARAEIARVSGGKPSDYAVQIGARTDDGGQHVAAVRLRTLQEAKAFAKSHGFRARGFGTRSAVAGFSQPPSFHIPIDKVKTAGLAFVGTAATAAVLGGGLLFYTIDPFNMWELPPKAADFAPFQQPNPGIERAGAPALPPVQAAAPAAPVFAALSADSTRYPLPYLPPRQLTADAQEDIVAPAALSPEPAPDRPAPAPVVTVNWPAAIATLPAPSAPDTPPALGLITVQNRVTEPPQPEIGTPDLPPIGPMTGFTAPSRPVTVANTAFFLEPLPATATRLSPDALADFVSRSGLSVAQLSRMAAPLMLMESKVVGVTRGLPPILPVLRSGRAIPEQVAPPPTAPEVQASATPAPLFGVVEGRPATIPPLRPAPAEAVPPENLLTFRVINGAPDIRPTFRPAAPAPAEAAPAEAETPPTGETGENTVAPEITAAENTQAAEPAPVSEQSALADAVSAAIAAATPPLEEPQLFALVDGQPALLPRLRSGADIPPVTQASATAAANADISPETAAANALRPLRRPQAIIDLPAPIDPMISGAAPATATRPLHRNASFEANAARIAETISNRPRASTPPVPVDPGTVNLPSSASVARAATIENAINLRTTNLIGIFGTADDRTALIRLSGGRMVRVKLGQTFSGWTVVAISENVVRIRKNNREEILRMPAE